MRRIGIALAATVFIFSCQNTKTQTNSTKTEKNRFIVGTVGDQQISYSELKANINSNSNQSATLAELEEFLPTYLNYIAKVEFAEDEGIMNDSELLQELEVYSKQAAYSYWLENRIKETEFEKYYDRVTTEIKSEHLLIAVPRNAPPSDTLEAYNRLIEARNKFLNGTSISDLDPEYSSRQNGRSMGGDLPWFTVGNTVKEFEDTIYSLEIGEISMPFRTQFGYHIVHLQGKRPRTLSREVAHIFKRPVNPNALSVMNAAYDSLESGKAWNEVVVEFTDDQLSASNGGSIGMINYGRYNTDFVDSVMSVDPNKEFSKPIRTSYGYHIFRIDSIQSFGSEQEKKDAYMKEFLDSPNFKKSNAFVIQWFQKEFTESTNSKVMSNLERFIQSKDTVRIGNIKTPDTPSAVIYSFKNYSFTKQHYFDYLKDTHGSAQAKNYAETWFNDFKTYSIDSKIVEMSVDEFPEFESTLDNYKKGLAVYQINDTYLWSAATVDTSELVGLYEQNPNKYSYPERFYYHMLSSSTDSTLDKGIEFIKEGNSPDSVRSYFPRIAVNRDSTGVFADDPYDRLESMKPGSFSDRFEYRRRKAVFYLNDILPERRMSFDEAFNRLLADYQPEREIKWLNRLRDEYNISTNIETLRNAFNSDK